MEKPQLWLYGPLLVKVMSLLFNMLSRFVIAFLPRSKHLLISWLKRIKSGTASTFSPSVCHDVMGLDVTILVFLNVEFQARFFTPLSPSSRQEALVPLCFLLLEWYHLHIWGCWYFSWQTSFQLIIHPAQHFTWCTLHISRVTIYSLVLLSQFWTSQLFHVWF